MNQNKETAEQILRNLAQTLADETRGPDELIDAFAKVENQKAEIGQLLTSLLDRQFEQT